MELIKHLSLSSEQVIRVKPRNFSNKDEKLFEKEFIKKLPSVFPILKKNSYVPPCGRLINGLSINLFQFSNKLGIAGLLKTYLKFFLFLIKTRKITQLDNILYVTTGNSQNFFHWFLDVLQKLEFVDQSRNQILNLKYKIIIPNDHDNNFTKNSLEAFGLDFYYQKKNEIVISNQSILLPNIAPTGNYRKILILKLNKRMRNYWYKNLINIHKNKRIYITRNNAKMRKLKNEAEIIPILKKNGFIILDFDKLNFQEQLKNVLNSEILISIHGSGLTHMLWMSQKSKILEIRAKDNCNDNCYYTLASDLDHNYFYVVADKTDPKKSDHISDLTINKNYFLSQLQKILEL